MGSNAWPDVKYGTPPTVQESDGYHKVVLISGFREWDDPTAIEQVLIFLRPTVLIHGAAAGADFIADRWAKAWKHDRIIIEPHKIPQEWWNLYGKRAGTMRNGFMVNRALDWELAGHKVLVVAFPAPESTGTINLIEQAIEANLPVLRYQ